MSNRKNPVSDSANQLPTHPLPHPVPAQCCPGHWDRQRGLPLPRVGSKRVHTSDMWLRHIVPTSRHSLYLESIRLESLGSRHLWGFLGGEGFKCIICFYWNIIDLQCCISYWCTAKWFSYKSSLFFKTSTENSDCSRVKNHYSNAHTHTHTHPETEATCTRF